MAFQNTVRQFPADGVVGDFSLTGDSRGQPLILKTTDAANNVIGRAVTLVAGTDGAAVAGGTGVFGGILAQSKMYPSYGTSDNPLDPSLVLPNNLPVQGITMHPGIFVICTTTANVGDGVAFKTTTGEIVAAPGGVAPSGSQLIPGASFIRNNITSANQMAMIQLLNS